MTTQDPYSNIPPLLDANSFNLTLGRLRYAALKASDPNSPLLIPPPDAPSGTVGLQACNVLAGAGRGKYSTDVAFDDVATWVIPLFLLVVNINYSYFQRQRYWNQVMVGAHLLGNPIDAVWSLLAKLDAGRRIRQRCRDEFREDSWVYATILGALDDIGFGEGFEDRFKQLKKIAIAEDEKPRRACRRAAINLSTPRVNNFWKAVLAAMAYITAVVANIARANLTGRIPAHLSHRIALRELFYWLIPAVILSAKASGFPSEWTSLGVMTDLQDQIPGLDLSLRRLEPWSGGNYIWRPNKDNSLSISGAKDHRRWILLLLSVLSVTASWATSFTMSYITPTKGMGARCLVEVCHWCTWIFTAGVTYVVGFVYRNKSSNWKKKIWFWLSGTMDLPIAFATVLVLFLSFLGWWNSCWSWSGAYTLGTKKAYIDLDMEDQIVHSMRSVFPWNVAFGIVGQVALAVVMLWFAQGHLFVRDSRDKEVQAEFEDRLERNRQGSVMSEMQAGESRKGGGLDVVP
ncbi:MAG: hypothetical protein M1816_003983 [Peltula sp. TS41687]|nr:MAG: hypothetical protein M1816_003983 [Peltula sp. TS41687]